MGEYAVVRYNPKVLVVMGYSESRTVKAAVKQILGDAEGFGVNRTLIDCVLVSAMRAVEQVSSLKTVTAAGRDVQVQQLAVKLNAFYTIEQVLRSPIIRSAVRDRGLELHASVINQR